MKLTVFTSNQPRHLALLDSLSGVADSIFAVLECNTLFPGEVPDFFRQSEVMRRYFSRVLEAEHEVFGLPRFSPPNVRTLSIKSGDASFLKKVALKDALESDAYIVFGASYLKGELGEYLIAKRAINVHMGLSPFYRGSSCNFWALYDNRPEYVGGTVHLLSSGIDSGPILFHAFPKPGEMDGFRLGMRAVKATIEGLASFLGGGGLGWSDPVPQDKAWEMRYSRHADFTDEIAAEYLARELSPQKIALALAKRPLERCVRPFFA